MKSLELVFAFWESWENFCFKGENLRAVHAFFQKWFNVTCNLMSGCSILFNKKINGIDYYYDWGFFSFFRGMHVLIFLTLPPVTQKKKRVFLERLFKLDSHDIKYKPFSTICIVPNIIHCRYGFVVVLPAPTDQQKKKIFIRIVQVWYNTGSKVTMGLIFVG